MYAIVSAAVVFLALTFVASVSVRSSALMD